MRLERFLLLFLIELVLGIVGLNLVEHLAVKTPPESILASAFLRVQIYAVIHHKRRDTLLLPQELMLQ